MAWTRTHCDDPDLQCSCKLLPGRHNINLFIISAQICIRNSHTCCRNASSFLRRQKCKYMLLYVCCHPATIPHRLTIARLCVRRFVCALYSNCSIFLLLSPIHRIRRTFNHHSSRMLIYLAGIFCRTKAFGARTNYINKRFALYYYSFFLPLSLVIC